MKSTVKKATVAKKRNTGTPARRTTTIKLKEFIPATPQELYEAFLNEEIHTEFTGAKATCDRRVGGTFTAWDGYISGTIVMLEDGRRIVQEWKTTEWPRGYLPSVVDFTFKQKADGTEATLIHSHVPSSQAADYQQGWIDFYFEPLKRYFAKK